MAHKTNFIHGFGPSVPNTYACMICLNALHETEENKVKVIFIVYCYT